MSLIFNCFFVVNQQATGVMHKKGELYTTCSPRAKIGHICQKMLFENFAHFLQKSKTVRILMLRTIFVIFAKMTIFFGEVMLGTLTHLSQISDCVFIVYCQLPAVTNKNVAVCAP